MELTKKIIKTEIIQTEPKHKFFWFLPKKISLLFGKEEARFQIWQYEIYQDGILIIRQDFKPNADGFIGMTEEEANFYADEILNHIGKAQNGYNKQ